MWFDWSVIGNEAVSKPLGIAFGSLGELGVMVVDALVLQGSGYRLEVKGNLWRGAVQDEIERAL